MLRMEIVGVCGTDWHYYHDELTGIKFPVILGHECVGRVHQIGKEASEKWGVREGQRIGVLEVIPCGDCTSCRSGYGNKFLGSHTSRYGAISTTVPPSLWGGFSEFMYLDSRSIVFGIPGEIPSEVASLVVPISNGLDWVEKGRPAWGSSDTIVILGPGQHGLGCVVAAKEAGASRIIVIGLKRDSKRLEAARLLGANYTIQGDVEDPVSRVSDFTSGALADIVVNVTDNSPESFRTCVRLTRKGGSVILSGYSHSVLDGFKPDVIIDKALTIRGVRGRELGSVKKAIDLMKENHYPLNLLCSHKFSLEDTDLALRTFARQISSSGDSIHVSILL
jgi:threonine dehydrogenase-like Zn-dependent dehydrogenase